MEQSDARRRLVWRGGEGDAGFGLVEVLVSMMLLTIVSVSLLPIFVTALRLAASNVSLATATQVVSEQMDLARDLAPTCDAINGWVAYPIDQLNVNDPKGNTLVVHRESAVTCPATYPAAYRIYIYVTLQGSNEKIAEAETRIHISSLDGS